MLHKNRIIDIVIILALGILPLTWFKGDLLISALDFPFSFDRIKLFISWLYLWNPGSIGAINSRMIAGLFPYGSFLAISELFGLSLVTTEKFLFYVWFVITGLSMYYLAITCKQDRTTALIASFFYMMNPYTLIFYWPMLTVTFVYTILPLILALFIKGIYDEKKDLRYAFYTLIGLLLATPSYPYGSFITWGLLLSFFVYFVFIHRKNKTKIRYAAIFTGSIFLLFILMNSYWLLPQLYLSQTEMTQVLGTTDITKTKPFNTITILDSIRLWGYWELGSGHAGDPYYLWASVYSSKFFVLISLIIPTLAFAAFLFKKRDQYLTYFGIVTITAIALISSLSPPFENITMSFLIELPSSLQRFWAQAYLRFGLFLALGYAFLIGNAFGNVFSFARKNSKSLFNKIIYYVPIFVLITMLFGIYMWPFWTGDIIYSGGNVKPSNHIQVPNYYYEAANWIGSQDQDFRIFPLPLSRLSSGAYTWDHGYLGYEPFEYIFANSVISRYTGQSYDLPLQLAERFYILNDHPLSNSNISKVLSLLNVKYLLFHRDANWKYIQGHPWWVQIYRSSDNYQSINISENQNSSYGFNLERSFGKLDFYRNEDWQPMHLYPASKVVSIDGGINEMITAAALSGSALDTHEVAIFLKPQQDESHKDILKTLNMTVVNLKSEKIMIPVNDNSKDYFTWASLQNGGYAARYFKGWKSVVRTDGADANNTLSFSSQSDSPYIFPKFSPTGWNAFNSTLIYVKTGNEPLRIDGIYGNTTFVGSSELNVWWETGWMGMGTKPVNYPITIPSNQRAIIQIEMRMEENVILNYLNMENLSKLHEKSSRNSYSPTITFQKIDSTKYKVHVDNTTEPFFLVFSESYSPQWKAYINENGDETNWFEVFYPKSISDDKHFLVNGYANAWYIDPNGINSEDNNGITMTLYFWPQSIFYIGMIISGLTFVVCLVYLGEGYIMKIFHRLRK